MSSIYLDLSNFKNKLQLDREDHLAESVVSLTDKQKLSLYKKSQKSGYSTDVLEEVYRRGHLIWKPELFEGTREQFAFDRVNSFISGGFAADLDSDLLDEGKGLWANIHAKRERIKAGSGEKMRKPGEKGAPTKEAIRSAQNEEFELLELEESAALAKKAKASGVSLGILKKVYARGVAAWRTGHRPGTTPQQWGMARVNSYITKGKGTYHGADKDLREARLPEVPKDKETGLPKKYTTGEKGTDRARAAHFAKGREKHWDDPSAYEKAPGDATAKTKESKHTKKYRQMYGEELQLEAKKLRRDPWDKMTRHLPHLKASQERAEAAVAGLKKAAQDYQAILDKEKPVKNVQEAATPLLRPGQLKGTPEERERFINDVIKGKPTGSQDTSDPKSEIINNTIKSPAPIAGQIDSRTNQPFKIQAPDQHLKDNPSQTHLRTMINKNAPKYYGMSDKQYYGVQEEYTGSEKVSKNKADSSSRFIGTKSLTDVYKKDTPGEMKEATINVIKRVVEEGKSSNPKPSFYSDRMRAATKFKPSDVSRMMRDEKARKAREKENTKKEKLDEDLSALLKANPQIKNKNLIVPGQEINLPTGGKYKVEVGDNLSNIASGKFKGEAPKPAAPSVTSGIPPYTPSGQKPSSAEEMGMFMPKTSTSEPDVDLINRNLDKIARDDERKLQLAQEKNIEAQRKLNSQGNANAPVGSMPGSAPKPSVISEPDKASSGPPVAVPREPYAPSEALKNRIVGAEKAKVPSVEGPVGPGSGRELVRRPDIVSPEARKAAGLDEPEAQTMSKGEFDLKKKLMQQDFQQKEIERQQTAAGKSQRFSPAGPEKNLGIIDMVDIQLDKLRRPLVNMGVISPMNLRNEETEEQPLLEQGRGDGQTETDMRNFYGSIRDFSAESPKNEKMVNRWIQRNQIKQFENPPEALVVHHTASQNPADETIRYMLNKSQFSTQWHIDRDGKVTKVLPDNVRGQHIRPPSVRKTDDNLSNRNTLGVEIEALNDKDITDAQKVAAAKLARHLGMTPDKMIGHGKLEAKTGHKEKNEGGWIDKFRGDLGLTQLPRPPADIPNVKPAEKKTETKPRIEVPISKPEQTKASSKDEFKDFLAKNNWSGSSTKVGDVFTHGNKSTTIKAGEGPFQAFQRLKSMKEETDQKSTLQKVKETISEATYKGRKVSLNKPFRTPGGPKKSAVYVDPDGDGKAKIVRFGDPNLSIKKHRPARKRSYCARSSGQGNLTDKGSANYWSRKAWDC